MSQYDKIKRMTLLELLIVIAIIVLLASILLPALKSARLNARTIQCKNNLKQFGIAFTMYLQDYNSTFPWSDNSAWPSAGYWTLEGNNNLQGIMKDYVTNGKVRPTGNKGIWACPLNDHSNWQYMKMGYSYFYGGDGNGANYLSWNWVAGRKLIQCDKPTIRPIMCDEQFGIHGVFVNVLYVDAHVGQNRGGRPEASDINY